MSERTWSPITKSPSVAGFTLIELLVVMLVGAVLLASFTGFYVAQQRTFRRHQIEIETSQALRTALEQISRDLRAAGRDPLGTAGAGITLADGAEVDFTLDANNDGAVGASDPNETKKFRRNGSAIESYRADQATPWTALASYVSGAASVFSYRKCDGTLIASLPASATDRAAIARIDITLTVTRSGGISLSRTETESVRLRNKACP